MLCDDLDLGSRSIVEACRGGMWRDDAPRQGIYVYLWLIRIAIQQKPTEHCKSIISLLKNEKRKS